MWVLHCRGVAAQRAKISSWFHSPELTSFTPAASHSFSPSHPPFPSPPTPCLHYVSPSEVLTPCRAVPALLASMSAFNEAWAGVRGKACGSLLELKPCMPVRFKMSHSRNVVIHLQQLHNLHGYSFWPGTTDTHARGSGDTHDWLRRGAGWIVFVFSLKMPGLVKLL